MDPSTLKILQGAAGAAGSDPIGVEDVFKTYLYTGTAAAKTINNGIDLSGEGGLLWTKNRSSGSHHYLFDTVRGKDKVFSSSNNDPSADDPGDPSITSFNNNGFSLGSNNGNDPNGDDEDYVSWTFRKQEKFFDIVTYTGNGTSGRTVSHSLGCEPGMILIKNLSDAEDWAVYHRSVGNTKFMYINSTAAAITSSTVWNDTTPTSSVFTLGDSNMVNGNEDSYVAYLFAHEEAEFGPNSDQKIISCGSFVGNGSATGPEINLGWEPQYILYKADAAGESWRIYDSMRGIPTGGNEASLYPNSSYQEENAHDFIDLTSTGFKIVNSDAAINGSGNKTFYMAIAAETGKTMKAVETASDVFAMSTGAGSAYAYTAGFPVDFGIYKSPDGTGNSDWWSSARLIQGTEAPINSTMAFGTWSGAQFDHMTKWADIATHGSNNQSWMFKRHAGFDVVTYEGDEVSGRQIPHSLGKVPEMMWVKNRSSANKNWKVYHKGLNGGTNPEDYYIELNGADAEANSATNWNDSAPSSTHFTLGNSTEINTDGENIIAMLFASVDGISKCGYFTGTGSEMTITTGFQPRFVILKKASATNEAWYVLDTTRGWGSGNDNRLELNSNSAQVGNSDFGAPTSTGFTLASNWNESDETTIYYAHA